jgi:hypothetical protein
MDRAKGFLPVAIKQNKQTLAVNLSQLQNPSGVILDEKLRSWTQKK